MKSFILIIGILFFCREVAAQGYNDLGYKTITSQELLTMLRQKPRNIIVIDLRSPAEFLQGHIKDAINLDENDMRFLEALDRLNKNSNYAVYSASMNMNTLAIHYMREDGFKGNIYNLQEGFEGWVKNNFPVDM